MNEKQINITFEEYKSLDELSQQDRALAEAAIDARKGSYSPYSMFEVGAAVRLEGGIIVKGANQENAAFPSGLCAERTAMFSAGAQYPDVPFESLALAGGPSEGLTKSPATPCGACRQVMAEYQTKSGRPMSIIMVGSEKIWKFEKVEALLPLIFDSI